MIFQIINEVLYNPPYMQVLKQAWYFMLNVSINLEELINQSNQSTQ